MGTGTNNHKVSKIPNHLRIAALQCNFEGGEDNTLAVADLWKEYGYNAEQLFHLHSELYSAVFDKEKHSAILGKYLRKTRENGIDVILYMNCHILLNSQAEKFSEWAKVDRDGNYIHLYETYKACCVNTSWTDYFIGAIRNLQEFDLAGIFLDGPVQVPCFCSSCQAKFKKEHDHSLMDASEDQIKEFALENMIEFIEKVYKHTKEINPQWLQYNNVGLLHSGSSVRQMKRVLDCNDLVGTEGGFQFGGKPRLVNIWRCGINAKAVDSAAGDKPKVIFIAGDQKPWSWYAHTPAETKLVYASTLANGCSAWYGVHFRTELLDSPAGAAAKEMVQFDKRNAALYENTKSVADVAIFFSFDTSKRYAATGEHTDLYASGDQKNKISIGNYTKSIHGAYDILFQSTIPADIVTEFSLDKLDDYSVLVVPTGACMSREVAEAITRYVENGGVLISDSETSLYDADFSKRDNFLLSDLLGVSYKGWTKYNNHDYFALEDASLLDGENIQYIPAPVVAVDVEVDKNAEVAARLFAPLAGRYAGAPASPERPLIIKNSVGKGVSYYFAGTFFELFDDYGISHYRKIINTIVKKHTSPDFELINAPASVEFTVREVRDSGNILIHLVNYSGPMSRPIEKVIPLSGIVLKISGRYSKAKSLTSGNTLQIADGKIGLEELNEFEVILLEL